MVNTSCAVYRCTSSSHKHKGIRFHQFPRDERIHIWLEACKRPDLVGKNVDQLKNMHICSLHFEHRMYGKLLLKKCAVPTLRLPTPAARSVHTQTAAPPAPAAPAAPAALRILTSEGVQTDHVKQEAAEYIDDSDITVSQFLRACDTLLPGSLSSFVKSHIYLKDLSHG